VNPPAFAAVGTITWLAIFEHNYHPRIYRYSEEVTILEIGNSELDFNHPPGAFSIWWQSGGTASGRRLFGIAAKDPRT